MISIPNQKHRPMIALHELLAHLLGGNHLYMYVRRQSCGMLAPFKIARCGDIHTRLFGSVQENASSNLMSRSSPFGSTSHSVFGLPEFQTAAHHRSSKNASAV
jgi:hypothetical protein